MTRAYGEVKHPGDHLFGLRKGDPVIYHRLGEELNCHFIELTEMWGKHVAAVVSPDWGLFLAPPSQVSISPAFTRPL